MEQERDTGKLPAGDPGFKIFCGFDWARRDHYFVLKDPAGRVLDEGYFPNTAAGFRDFLARLDARRDGGQVALIIEATRNAACLILAAVGWITLYPSNPSKTRKLIELDGSGKGKGDRRDAGLLCDHLITSYRRLRPDLECDEDVLCLRELVESEDRHIAERTRLKNRIKAQFHQFCPGLEELVGGRLDTRAYTQYLLEFDPRHPADDAAVAAQLRKYNVRRKKSIEAFLEGHRALELLPLGAKLLAVHAEKLRAMVRALHFVAGELASVQDEIDAYFNELPNAEIYRSQPGLGERLAPRMAALFGKDPTRNFASKAEACAYLGQSPVTNSSGGCAKSDRGRARPPGKKVVKRRQSCNRKARHAVHLWARGIASLGDIHAPWQRCFLERLKGRGDHPATRYRKLGKKLVAILYTCLVNNENYSLETYSKNAHAP